MNNIYIFGIALLVSLIIYLGYLEIKKLYKKIDEQNDVIANIMQNSYSVNTNSEKYQPVESFESNNLYENSSYQNTSSFDKKLNENEIIESNDNCDSDSDESETEEELKKKIDDITKIYNECDDLENDNCEEITESSDDDDIVYSLNDETITIKNRKENLNENLTGEINLEKNNNEIDDESDLDNEINTDLDNEIDDKIENKLDEENNNQDRKYFTNFTKMNVKDLRKILEDNQIYMPVRSRKDDLIKELNKLELEI